MERCPACEADKPRSGEIFVGPHVRDWSEAEAYGSRMDTN
jgi:hypothetical protein